MREYLCPNCVTPWKCNGPHIPESFLHANNDADGDSRTYTDGYAFANPDCHPDHDPDYCTDSFCVHPHPVADPDPEC